MEACVIESAFLNLIRGNRLSSYLGLEMAHGHHHKFSPTYAYVEVPVLCFENEGEKSDEVKRNQHVFVRPACSISVKGHYVVEIEPCIELAKLGQVQASYKVHPGSGALIPGFWFTARKDVKLSDLNYAIRLYMYA